MDELVKDLKNLVAVGARTDGDDDYLLMNSKYVPVKISPLNFHNISVTETKSGLTVLFVDGGNSILFESAEFCIGIICIGGIFYENNRRIKRNKKEFYIFVKEENEKFNVKTYPETDFDNMVFDPEDESLRNGLEKCSVSRIVSVIRRFAELDYASTSCKDSSENVDSNADFIVLDGTLEARYPHEEKYLEKLFRTGRACALSKTCGLTTKNGFSITKKLSDMSQAHINNSTWYYTPIVTNNNPKHFVEIYFVKLHKKSSHIFRFEIQKDFKGNVNEVFSGLSINSSDPIFFGYPYGLIDIDQYVRISDEETKLLQTKLSIKLGKQWNDFSKHLDSINAHSILDKIKF